MNAQAKGWTHPEHWVVALVGTVCQILAAVFITGAFISPLFTDHHGDPGEKMYSMHDLNIKCEDSYCYDEEGAIQINPQKGKMLTHVLKLNNKANPAWLPIGRILIAVGAVSNLLSLALLVLVFWPVVLAGKVLNVVLHLCRTLDFFGAPTKFLGAFFLLCNISEINISYSWRKYGGLLQMNPLPLGFVLFSYILQTLCFVCATLATDTRAQGQQTHLEILEQQTVYAELEHAEEEKFQRVSYHHPLDTKRSSRLLTEVEQHFSAQQVNV